MKPADEGRGESLRFRFVRGERVRLPASRSRQEVKDGAAYEHLRLRVERNRLSYDLRKTEMTDATMSPKIVSAAMTKPTLNLSGQ